jgi:hypothetical protein
MNSDDKVFVPNSFQTPNTLVDDVMAMVSGAAYKILMAITRHTLGWSNDGAIQIGGRQLGCLNARAIQIGLAALQEITGLSRQAAIDGGRELKRLDLILVTKGPRNSRVSNAYSLNLDLTTGELVKKLDQSKKLTSATSLKSRPRLVQKVDSLNTNTTNTAMADRKRRDHAHNTRKESHPRVTTLLASFIRKYQETVGEAYPVVRGKDPRLLKDLLDSGQSVEAIDETIGRYFADPYYQQIGFDVGGFKAAYSKLRSAGAKPKHDYEKDAYPPLS